jgi:hypothetical protein
VLYLHPELAEALLGAADELLHAVVLGLRLQLQQLAPRVGQGDRAVTQVVENSTEVFPIPVWGF